MRSAHESAVNGASPAEFVSNAHDPDDFLKKILLWLDDTKAEDIVTIDLAGKSSLGDYMIVATGRSDRHVGAVAEQLQRKLRDAGYGRARIEGMPNCDWVLIDTGDIIVHVFRQEVREFYNIEKMWQAERPADPTAN